MPKLRFTFGDNIKQPISKRLQSSKARMAIIKDRDRQLVKHIELLVEAGYGKMRSFGIAVEDSGYSFSHITLIYGRMKGGEK